MTSSTATPQTDSAGTTRWQREGECHRTDGPAVEYANGYKAWYVNGCRHRVDGPAVERANGGAEWWVNGKRHRVDGVVVEWADGTKEWYVKGRRHRIDGPAIERSNGSKEWWLHGNPHRTGSPAIEHADGTKEWWVNGEEICSPSSHVLNAAFTRRLTILPDVLSDMLKAMSKKQGEQSDQLNQLNSILHKHWPMHMKNILATLFMDDDAVVKNLAFLLLGREVLPENPQGRVRF